VYPPKRTKTSEINHQGLPLRLLPGAHPCDATNLRTNVDIATQKSNSTQFEQTAMSQTLYDFTAQRLNGEPQALDAYRGKVVLIVNTASQCGFTPQYTGLEELYRRFKDQGFVVLGFPCNQFGAQEPGDAEAIGQFCQTRFDVSFPLFAKIDVNGDNAHPLYTWLKHEAAGILGTEAIKWNFTKFLINREGKVIDRYAPATRPDELAEAVEALL
jgi:glutathione peroxidase